MRCSFVFLYLASFSFVCLSLLSCMPRNEARDTERCQADWSIAVKHVDTVIHFVAAGTAPANDALLAQGADASLRQQGGCISALLGRLSILPGALSAADLPESYVSAVWGLSDKFDHGLAQDAREALVVDFGKNSAFF